LWPRVRLEFLHYSSASSLEAFVCAGGQTDSRGGQDNKNFLIFFYDKALKIFLEKILCLQSSNITVHICNWRSDVLWNYTGS